MWARHFTFVFFHMIIVLNFSCPPTQAAQREKMAPSSDEMGVLSGGGGQAGAVNCLLSTLERHLNAGSLQQPDAMIASPVRDPKWPPDTVADENQMREESGFSFRLLSLGTGEDRSGIVS